MLPHPLIKVIDRRNDDEKQFGNYHKLRDYEFNWYSEGLPESPTESDCPSLITLTEIR